VPEKYSRFRSLFPDHKRAHYQKAAAGARLSASGDAGKFGHRRFLLIEQGGFSA
jgi:hypothetical protein